MGGAEAVKAVHEGVPASNGGQMGNGSQIHSLLRRGRHQHSKTSHAAGHCIRVVAKNG
ncbi:hypothetical protein SDC9_117032 [bioreactor metagenome]|uniref:Uncharacterized protein n=1 Tax=bioreactor metagenome TaxID=1076179 RepID=A0A645BZH1_9ZZZZ